MATCPKIGMDGWLPLHIRPFQAGSFPRTHAGFQDKNRNISSRLRGRFQVLRFQPMAEHEFTVPLTP